jgi:hypothetical protein
MGEEGVLVPQPSPDQAGSGWVTGGLGLIEENTQQQKQEQATARTSNGKCRILRCAQNDKRLGLGEENGQRNGKSRSLRDDKQKTDNGKTRERRAKARAGQGAKTRAGQGQKRG